jgi:hypothetical protein
MRIMNTIINGDGFKMRVFIKLVKLDYFDIIFYLSKNAITGDIYNNGEKRYLRRNKTSECYSKWKSL